MAPETLTDAIRVTHLPTGARGGRLVEFAGDDAVAVLARATAYWSSCDAWLRDAAPIVRPADDGRYVATVRVWSAE